MSRRSSHRRASRRRTTCAGRGSTRSLYRRPLRLEPLEDRRLLALVTVTTALDTIDFNDGVTSLREAIFATNTVPGADTINFDFGHDGPATILLTQGELRITDDLTITGPGANLLTIDASGNDPTPDVDDGLGSRVFRIDDGNTSTQIDVTLSGLTLTGGDVAGQGGAILSRENVTLRSCIVTGNASRGTGSGGGGIYSREGALTVLATTIANNSAVGGRGNNGGGILAYEGEVVVIDSSIENNSGLSGGGVFVRFGRLTIFGSTFTGNSSNSGGAIHSSYCHLSIDATTISGNSSGRGGGIEIQGGTNLEIGIRHTTITQNDATLSSASGGGIIVFAGPQNHLTLDHTIVARNTAASNASDIQSNLVPLVVSSCLIGTNFGSSLIEAPVGLPDANGNLIGGPVHGAIDPLLGPLADNGGPTLTHALLAGSPAINRGDLAAVAGQNGVPLYDQRGEPFGRIFGGRIDIGAFEFQEPSDLNLLVDTLVDENDGDYSRGDLSLREAIALANLWSSDDTIHFDPALAGGTILLSLDDLLINDDVTIVGLGADQLTIDGRGNDSTPDVKDGGGLRIFRIVGSDGMDMPFVTISGLALTGGDSGPNGGAILSFGANLTIEHTTITGNASREAGGAISHSLGMLTIIDSILANNMAQRGGAINSFGGLPREVIIESSTITGNMAMGLGGGFYIRDGNLTVRNSTISGNSAVASGGSGGGIYFRDLNGSTTNRLEIIHSTISNNSALRAGGGVWALITAGALTLDGNTIAENSIVATNPDSMINRGGGLFASLQNVLTTISGNLIRDNSAAGGGGAWLSVSNGQTLIADSTISGNTASGVLSRGGGIYLASQYGGYPNNTTATIRNSTISDNTAFSDFPNAPYLGRGGGIFSRMALDVVDSTISGNVANDSGGGHFADGSRPVSITRSTIHGNSAGVNGGGVVSRLGGRAPLLFVNESTLTANTAGQDGGGLFMLGGPVAVSSSTFGGNSAARDGGGLRMASGPNAISGSTFSGNSAGRNGGAMTHSYGGTTVTNSTLSGNSAGALGGGIWSNFAATLAHSTVFNNRAEVAGGGAFVNVGPLNLNHAIVAGNTAPTGRDLTGLIGATITAHYSLIGNNASSGLTPAPVGSPDANGNVIGGGSVGTINPQLGPLADNGGPTLTHALLLNSPAINAGDPAATPGVGGVPVHDQRGEPFIRVFGGRIDIGAFETLPAGFLPGDYNHNGVVDVADSTTWRNMMGTVVSPGSGADGNGDGLVDDLDYDVWKSNFGSTVDDLPPSSPPLFDTGAMTGSKKLASLGNGAASQRTAGVSANDSRPAAAVDRRPAAHWSERSRPAAPASIDRGILAWLAGQRHAQRRDVEPLRGRSSGDHAAEELPTRVAVDAAFDLLGAGG